MLWKVICLFLPPCLQWPLYLWPCCKDGGRDNLKKMQRWQKSRRSEQETSDSSMTSSSSCVIAARWFVWRWWTSWSLTASTTHSSEWQYFNTLSNLKTMFGNLTISWNKYRKIIFLKMVLTRAFFWGYQNHICAVTFLIPISTPSWIIHYLLDWI